MLQRKLHNQHDNTVAGRKAAKEEEGQVMELIKSFTAARTAPERT